ncbi:hypothetical protein GCM10022405_32430 [Gibbsiella dentisursi]|uniref:Uncharacterized protein n=1 Tax=Gibbsiella dentisursi TaxID=796890 RepID=A0ABP7LRD4_9GAMM
MSEWLGLYHRSGREINAQRLAERRYAGQGEDENENRSLYYRFFSRGGIPDEIPLTAGYAGVERL